MTGTVVLSSKMHAPPAQGLRRPRLTTLLSERATVLVTGAAGCGKSTLLSHAAAAAAGPVGWYRATGQDASAEAMVAHLGAALSVPVTGGRQGIDNILSGIEQQARPHLLVVDDAHEIRGTQAERTLGHFLELRSPRLRVLIGSRQPPAINITRMRLSGALVELSDEQLRFRSWEVEDLFRQVFAEPLPPEAAAALTRKTGGWAAGLQLFHLATEGRDIASRVAAVRHLDGRSGALRRYLAQNVLDGLGTDRRDFLTRSCALGLLTADLCDRLLDRQDSAAVLLQLADEHVFCTSDDQGRSYRYHQVLRSHLEASLLESLGVEATRRWYQRCAQLLESVGAVFDALRAHARAEDWGSVARLLQQAGAELPVETGEELAGILPAVLVRDDPWLAMAEGRRAVRAGYLSAAVAAYRRAESLFEEPAEVQQCRRARAVVEAWLPDAIVTDRDVRAGGWAVRVRRLTQRLEPTAPAPDSVRPGERLVAGLDALLAGRVAVAEERLASVLVDPDAAAVEGVVALLACSIVARLDGRAGEAVRKAREAGLWAEVEELPWLAALARELESALDPAPQRPRPPAPLDADPDDPWGAALRTLVRGLAAARDGDAPGRAMLADAARRLDDLSAPVPSVWARAVAALTSARAGSAGAAGDARAAAISARRLGVRGAELVATVGLGLVTSGPEQRARRRDAASLAVDCGLPDVVHRLVTAVAPAASVGTGQVRIRLLGGFSVAVDGVPLDLDALRPRARSLLRLFALRAGSDLHREHLVDVLWPGASSVTGTRSLQVAVSSLRRLFESAGLPGADTVQRHGEAYRLALPAASTVDVQVVDRALHDAELAARGLGSVSSRNQRVQALQTVLDTYRGELLPEEGPAEWVARDRERIRVAVAGAGIELAKLRRELGNLTEAISAVERALATDRFQDQGWTLLARLHDAAGDRAAASRVRTRHAELLAELDVAASSPRRTPLVTASPGPRPPRAARVPASVPRPRRPAS